MNLITKLKRSYWMVRLALQYPGLIIGTLPDTLVNGTPDDAVPVMANFNYIVSQVNANAAPLSGTPQLNLANTYTQPQTAAGAQSVAQLVSMQQALAIDKPSLSFSVGSSALTATLNDFGGNALSATNVTAVLQRSATATSGAQAIDITNSAITLTIPSGATLGHINAVTGYLYWYLQDNGGTESLAVCGTYQGISLIGNSTTIGAGSTSGNTIYATAGLSGVAMHLIAITADVQTTAGTWTATPSQVYTYDQIMDNAIQLHGFTGTQSVSSSTSYTAETLVANGNNIVVTAASTQTLPAPSTCPNGMLIGINAQAGGVVVSATITSQNGTSLASHPLGKGGTLILQNNGSAWNIIHFNNILASGSASGASAITFTSLISAAYNKYSLRGTGFIGSSANASVNVNASINNGISYDSGTNYSYNGYLSYASGLNNENGASETSFHAVIQSLPTGSQGVVFELDLMNPNDATYYKVMRSRFLGYNSVNGYYACSVDGYYQNSSAINAFELTASAGTLTGSYVLYGYI